MLSLSSMESPDGKPMDSGSGAATMSRDFWMPDNSCMVCYDCDSPFNFYNRRHHCRLCGRIFCAKCTSNFVSADPKNAREEGERLRVCNYCYKQREREQETSVVDSGLQVLSPSPSTISLASSKSSGSGNSSTSTVSVAYSTGGYQCASYCSGSSPRHSLGTCPEKQDLVVPTKDTESFVDIGDPSPKEANYFMNRFRSSECSPPPTGKLSPATLDALSPEGSQPLALAPFRHARFYPPRDLTLRHFSSPTFPFYRSTIIPIM